jgi:hypothetical protein
MIENNVEIERNEIMHVANQGIEEKYKQKSRRQQNTHSK